MAYRSTSPTPPVPEARLRASRYHTSEAARLEAALLAEAADTLGETVQQVPLAQTESATSILIVDDDADMRAYVKRCLRLSEQSIASVLEVADAETALALMQETVPTLVISATRLPEMDGFMLCKTILASPALRHIPVLLVSGEMLANASRRRARKVGASGYLGKPFNAHQFCDALSNVLPLTAL